MPRDKLPRTKYICKFCHKEFEARPSASKPHHYCSLKCATAAGPHQKAKVTLLCKSCGRSFQVIPSLANRQFCSRKCTKTRSTKPIIKTCPICNKTFAVSPNENKRIYCSRQCANARSFPESRARNCAYCGQSFIPPAGTGRQFCSRQCFSASQVRPPKTCQRCGKEFIPHNNRQRFCSPACQKTCRVIPSVKIACLNCGKEFSIRPKQAARRRYCSKQCQSKHQFRSSQESAIIATIEQLVGECALRQHTFSWLKSPCGQPLRLDAYFLIANLAIEYDGRQHYEFDPHYHVDEQQFQALQQRDSLKDSLLSQHGIPLLRISYREPKTADYLRQKLSILQITAAT